MRFSIAATGIAPTLEPSKSAAEARVTSVNVTSQMATNLKVWLGSQSNGHLENRYVNEDDDGLHCLGDHGVSKSLAQQELEELVGPLRISQRPLDDPPEGCVTEDGLRRSSIPRFYSHSLPIPHSPQSPRTIRRQMIVNEMSESLRRNLVWERTVSRRELGGLSRVGPVNSMINRERKVGEETAEFKYSDQISSGLASATSETPHE